MINEYLKYSEGQVKLPPGSKGTKEPIVYNLNEEFDPLYRLIFQSDFGTSVMKATQELHEIKKIKEENLKMRNGNIDGLREAFEMMPEIQRRNQNIEKNFDIINAINKQLERRGIAEMNKIDVIIGDKAQQKTVFSQIREFIMNNKYTSFDKIRVALLYCIQFPQDSHGRGLLIADLKGNNISRVK